MNSLGFSSVFCTSEDPNYPFENLFRDNTQTGWISLPSPNFPIEAIIDMKMQFVLTGLDIVSHESMIATRVDLFGTKDEELNEKTSWFSIGYFTFNSNQRSQWVARELKHVSTDSCSLRYLRFLIEGGHETPPNREHRISFISLSLNGHREIKPRMTNVKELVEDLTNAKLQAIEEENFGAAAIYKDELLNIQENKDELEKLFSKKVEMLNKEEYLEVDDIMQRINSIMKHERPDETEFPKENQIQKTEIIGEEPPSQVPPHVSARVARPVIDDEPAAVVIGNDDGFFLTEFEKDTVLAIASDESIPQQVSTTRSKASTEEEQKETPPPPPKKVKKVKPKPAPAAPIEPPKERVPRFSKAPPEAPKKSDEPDELSDENRAEASTLISLFGEKVVSIAYSSNWSLRVSGIEKLCELIKGLKTKPEKTRALSGMLPLLRRRFCDGLKATYVCAVEQTISLLDNLGVEGNELGTVIHVLLPIAMGKIGDTNQRINEVSNQFALWCTEKDKWAYNEVQAFAVHPPANNQYHQQIAKLNLVISLIDKYGIGEKGKLKLNDVMNLVVPCLDSRKEEVRKLAIKLTVVLQEKFGSSIEKYLKNVSRLVKDQLAAAAAANSEGK